MAESSQLTQGGSKVRRPCQSTMVGGPVQNCNKNNFEGDTNNTAKILLIRICVKGESRQLTKPL